jgi:hypothetical protein
MRAILVATLLACLPAMAPSHDARRDSLPRPRSVTVTTGIGNAMGWWGLQGEKYLRNQRISLFSGLGSTPGLKHRGFLELSVAQIEIESGCFTVCSRYYGPSLQAGYQCVSRRGFTLALLTGAGYAPGGSASVVSTGGLGVGYTWLR